MSETSKDKPFEILGKQLKSIRIKRQESLAEASGAVEIDPEVLGNYEDGAERPAEDILLLLISHFAAKEDVATKLWELAGYSHDELPAQNVVNDLRGHAQNGVVVLPADARITYTDMVHVMVNNYGVVMNFMQTAGLGNQPMAVARLGMSREHAQSVLEVLQKTLALHDPKALSPENSKKPNEKTDK